MFCRTGLLVLTAGLTFAGVAAAEDDAATAKNDATADAAPSPEANKPQKAKTGDGADEKAKSDTDGNKKTAQLQGSTSTQNTSGRGTAVSETPDEEEQAAKKAPPHVPWRGTAVGWDHTVTASALGIGDDFQSDSHQQYVQTFSLGLNYFVIDEEVWSLAVATGPSVSVELTDSGSTTTRNEPWFNDLNSAVVLRARLFSDKDSGYATGMIFNHTLLYPTSPASAASGTIITTSPRVMNWHSFPLLPKSVSPVLNSVLLGASVRWDHRFGLATTAVNDDLQRTRQNAQGNTFASDQLSFGQLTQDTLREGFFLFFSEDLGPTNLQLFASWSFNQTYQPELGGSPNANCVVELDTGCVADSGTHNDEVIGETPNWQHGYGFAVGLSFFPMPEWGLNVAYANSTNQLGPDGQRRSPFYSPNAQFSAGIVVSIDGIYEAIVGPPRDSNFVLFSKNEPQKKKKNDEKKSAPAQLPIAF